MSMTREKALEALSSAPTIPVEVAGIAIGLGRTASYSAAARGDFETVRIGGRIFVLTAPLRAKLRLDEKAVA